MMYRYDPALEDARAGGSRCPSSNHVAFELLQYLRRVLRRVSALHLGRRRPSHPGMAHRRRKMIVFGSSLCSNRRHIEGGLMYSRTIRERMRVLAGFSHDLSQVSVSRTVGWMEQSRARTGCARFVLRTLRRKASADLRTAGRCALSAKRETVSSTSKQENRVTSPGGTAFNPSVRPGTTMPAVSTQVNAPTRTSSCLRGHASEARLRAPGPSLSGPGGPGPMNLDYESGIHSGTGMRGQPLTIRSAASHARAMTGAAELPETWKGRTEASMTRSPSTPRTRRSPSTTSSPAGPIAHEPTA